MSQINQDKSHKNVRFDTEQTENKQYGIDNGTSALDHLDENDNDTIKYQLLHSGEPVILNVGGVKYSTSLLTLSSNTGSILHKMFTGTWSLQPCKDGSYFFDRNGELFKYVLEYLRNNKLNVAYDTTLINALICEAEYYQLVALRSELIIQKTKSAVLKKGDPEFITKSINESFQSFEKPFEISHEHLIYSYSGNNCIDYDNLHGLDGLLFLLRSEDDDTFGVYIHGRYAEHNQPDGFVFDLDSKLTGKHCFRKKYMPWKPGHGAPIHIEDSSESTMFEATIFCNEHAEFLDCTITKDDASRFVCECKWIQTDNDRTVFNKSIKRFEIFRVL